MEIAQPLRCFVQVVDFPDVVRTQVHGASLGMDQSPCSGQGRALSAQSDRMRGQIQLEL